MMACVKLVHVFLVAGVFATSLAHRERYSRPAPSSAEQGGDMETSESFRRDNYHRPSDFAPVRNSVYDVNRPNDRDRGHDRGSDRDHDRNNDHHDRDKYRDHDRDIGFGSSGTNSIDRPRNNNGTFDYDPLEAAFPKRMALRVENQRSEFNACGGFSGGSSGTCCTACVKLGYRRGCWCRTWDCLCYDA